MEIFSPPKYMISFTFISWFPLYGRTFPSLIMLAWTRGLSFYSVELIVFIRLDLFNLHKSPQKHSEGNESYFINEETT